MASEGRLTTHVLDTATGKPAGGLRIDLYRLDGARALIRTVTTNGDGRAVFAADHTLESVHGFCLAVVDALKLRAVTDGPVHWKRADA